MAWIQVDDGIREHDKIYNLADALGISNAYAVGLMVCFWTWAATAAPDGDVTNFPPRAISKAAGWDKGGAKGAQQFYDELVRIRFLEKREGDKVFIRNWEQRANLLLDYIEQQRENTRRRVQKCRERKKKKQGPSEAFHNPTPVTPYNNTCSVTETLCNGATPPPPKSTLPEDKLSVNNTPSPPTAEEPTSVDGGAGKDFGRVCQAFEGTVNPMPSSKDGMILSELYRDYPLQRVLDAITETARCQGHSASYVRSIIQNEGREAKGKGPPGTAQYTDPEYYKKAKW